MHLRLWLAEQVAHQVDPVGLAGAPWVSYYARALGAKLGANIDLHSLPPVTGMLEIADGAAIEPEVDLSGYWIDGDTVRIGGISIGAGATIGTRSTLAPGTRIGRNAEIAPGSAVFGRVRAGQRWAGSPAVRVGGTSSPLAPERPPTPTRWLWAYGASSAVLGLLPFLAIAAGGILFAYGIRGATSIADAVPAALVWLVPSTLVVGLSFARGRRGAREAAVDRAGRGGASGARPGGVAGVDDRAAARLGPDDAVSPLLQPVHSDLAAHARRRGRP